MAVDSLGVLETLRSMPEQLAKAHEVAGEALAAGSLPSAHDFDNVVVMGMGGSGIVGDVVQAVGTATLPVPLVVLKHYRTPSFVGPRTLAFAVSYSGGTEETLGMAQGALDAGATLVVITSGGALGELAKKAGALHIPCTTDTTMPRLALCAMVAPVFVVLFRMGMLPEAHAGMVKAQQQLARRRDRCKPEVDAPANPARARAQDRRHDPDHPRRGWARRRRGDALEAVDERERQGAGVLELLSRSSTTTRSAGGASTATSRARCSASSRCATGSSTRSSRRACASPKR